MGDLYACLGQVLLGCVPDRAGESEALGDAAKDESLGLGVGPWLPLEW